MASSRILFACTLNAIRSPMAEGILNKMGGYDVESCGVYASTTDLFSIAACQKNDIDITGHISRSFEELPRTIPFDQTIALSEEAYAAANALPMSFTGKVHFWPMPVPANFGNRREQQLAAYNELFNKLSTTISQHFF